MQDQLMTVKQLATYLNVNERTVLKLVQEGMIPGVRIGNQWRFRRPMIDTWLDDQALGITPRSVETGHQSPRRVVTLSSCFEVANIVPDLRGTTKTEVVVELATRAKQLGLVSDEAWFVGALFQREGIMPSAVANGYAVLHTLQRHPERIAKPFLVLGRSCEGVDFDALDDQRTHVFFVLGLRYSQLELPWLTRIVRQFDGPEMLRALLQARHAEEIFEVVQDAGTLEQSSEETA